MWRLSFIFIFFFPFACSILLLEVIQQWAQDEFQILSSSVSTTKTFLALEKSILKNTICIFNFLFFFIYFISSASDNRIERRIHSKSWSCSVPRQGCWNWWSTKNLSYFGEAYTKNTVSLITFHFFVCFISASGDIEVSAG